MESLNYIRNYLSATIRVKQAILNSSILLKQIEGAAEVCIAALKNHKRIFFAGNGGRAADAQHLAAEFGSRFNYDRPGLAGIALTTDTSILTAVGNDYGYEKIFERQLEALSQPEDVFVGLTTSGNSGNILKAVETARKMGVYTIGLCGETGRIHNLANMCIAVPCRITPYIQESHITIGHILCAIIEYSLHPQDRQCHDS